MGALIYVLVCGVYVIIIRRTIVENQTAHFVCEVAVASNEKCVRLRFMTADFPTRYMQMFLINKWVCTHSIPFTSCTIGSLTRIFVLQTPRTHTIKLHQICMSHSLASQDTIKCLSFNTCFSFFFQEVKTTCEALVDSPETGYLDLLGNSCETTNLIATMYAMDERVRMNYHRKVGISWLFVVCSVHFHWCRQTEMLAFPISLFQNSFE